MYTAIKTMVYVFLKIVFRLKIIGAENIPANGGAIIACNHISLWDPPTVGAGMKREINFMAKEELFSFPPLRWVITVLKAFPIKRGAADRNAIRHALQLLKNGEILGLFPEGTRSKTGQLGKAEPGLAMIALKAGVPIIPAAVTGTNQVFRNGQLLPQFVIRFGKPLEFVEEKGDKTANEKLSAAIMQEISKLQQER